MSELNVKLKEAMALHQQGQLAQAKIMCEYLLTSQPNNADAAHLLGIIEYQSNNRERAAQIFGQAAAMDPTRVDLFIHLGNVLYELNRFEEAVASYDQAISINPTDAVVYLNRGLALAQLNQHEAAIESHDRAININPNFFDAHFNRGNALAKIKQWELAVQSYDCAINIKPDYAVVYFSLGNALHALGKLEAAIENYNQVITINPHYADAYNNRGNILQELKRWDEAIESYNLAININSDFAESYFNRGNSLQALQRFEEAVHSFDSAIALRPDFIDAYLNRGNALQALMQFEAALESYDQAIAINPNFSDAYYSRGNVFKKRKFLEEAIENYDRAITINPAFAAAYSNRGLVFAELKQWEAAIKDYDRAIALKPDYAEFYQNKSLLLLAMNRFEEGWELYKWRSKLERANLHPIKITNEWNGKKLNGSLLVLPEQGMGDEIFYSNMLNDLQYLATRITVCVDPRLIPLYERSFDNIKFISRQSLPPINEFDAQIYMGSLGIFFRTNQQALQNIKSPYLKAFPQKTKELRQRLKNKKLLCGLSWVSANADFGAEKTLRLQDLKSILSLPDIDFINLQYGDTADEQTTFLNETGIKLTRVTDIDNYSDIDGLASLIDACDVVLTISNTTAHLAAALGKNVIIMLPHARGLFWYWHQDGETTPWYPTAKLVRQSINGDWASVTERVKFLLARRVGHP